MASSYLVITYGGGEILQQLFNGIAAAVSTKEYKTALIIVGFIGFTMSTMEGVFKMQMQVALRWFAGFYLIYGVLFIPKVTVHIQDNVTKAEISAIDHVPWALGFFSSSVTQLFDEITKLSERVFALPNDLRYTQSGSVMASTLMTQASKLQITDPVFSDNVQHFVQQCVFYDLLLHKYTEKDLFMDNDIWSFVRSHASPARSFLYADGRCKEGSNLCEHKTKIKTCQEGAGLIGADWKRELTSASDLFGTHFFPSASNASNIFRKDLANSTNYLTGIAKTANEMMRQTMMNNAIDRAVINYDGEVDASAALQSYAFSRAQQTKRNLYQVIGEQAAYWLPLIRIIFESLLFGAFIFLAPLMLLPAGWQLLKHYLFAMVWVESWSPLYAILNLVMTVSARRASIAAVSHSGTQAINMMTMPGLAQVNHDMALLAGYFSMSIPVLAYYLIKGGAMGFMSIAQTMGGATQAAASQAVQESTTGNLSFGNVNVDNQSMHNLNSNHWDSNMRYMAGGSSAQLPGGSTASVTPDGHTVVDNRGAISSLGSSINLAESVRSAFSHQAESADMHSQSAAENYGKTLATAVRTLDEFGTSHTHAVSDAHGHTKTSTDSTVDSATQMSQLIDKFSQSHNVSHAQAGTALISAYGKAHLGIDSTNSLEGKVLGFITGIKAGAEIGVKAEGSYSWTKRDEDLESQANEYLYQDQNSHIFEKAIRNARDDSHRVSDDNSRRVANTVANSFEQSEQSRQEVATLDQQSKSYRHYANLSKEQSVSINANAAQPFVEWLEQQSAPMSQGPMGLQSASYILSHKPDLAIKYAERWGQLNADKMRQSFDMNEDKIKQH